MKLFVITHSYAGDGASQMLCHAAEDWVRQRGWQVDAVAGPDMTDDARRHVAQSGMRLIPRAHFGEAYDVALINCLKNIHFVDLIYPHVPIVLWAHEAETILKSQVPREKWQGWFAKASLVIFQTDWQMNLYRKYLSPESKVAVLANGIPPASPAPQPAREADSAFRIVTVGKLTPMKAQSGLIRVVPKLAQRHNVHCQLIGDTEYLPRLETKALTALARHPQLFTLSGYLPRDQALGAVAAADVFCFPSISESFGLAPLEAAGLGIPVVLADLGVYKSVGWVSGENCLMFPPGDVKRMEAALDAVIKDASLRAKLAEKGRSIAAGYTMDAFLPKISELVAEARLKVV